MWIDPRWVKDGERRYDVAVLRIAKEDGKTVQDVVGGQGVDFRGTDHDDVNTIGYPVEPLPDDPNRFDGKSQERCIADDIEVTEEDLYFMRCRLTGGASGGPWIDNLDPKTGLGTIVAVTSAGNEKFTDIAGPPLRNFVHDLIEAADRNDTKNSNDDDSSDA
jgi:hypothetical protein